MSFVTSVILPSTKVFILLLLEILFIYSFNRLFCSTEFLQQICLNMLSSFPVSNAIWHHFLHRPYENIVALPLFSVIPTSLSFIVPESSANTKDFDKSIPSNILGLKKRSPWRNSNASDTELFTIPHKVSKLPVVSYSLFYKVFFYKKFHLI